MKIDSKLINWIISRFIAKKFGSDVDIDDLRIEFVDMGVVNSPDSRATEKCMLRINATIVADKNDVVTMVKKVI